MAAEIGAVAMLVAGACGSSSPKRSSGPTTASTQPSTTFTTSTTAPPVTIATTTLATTPPTTVTAVDTHILVYGDCKNPTVEPVEIVLACADYGSILQGLHWTGWTPTRATGVGTYVYNDCTPSCAEGHHHQVPGTQVTLTVPVRGAGGQLVWSELEQNPEPPGYESGPFAGRPFPLLTQPD
jgi:hypothetical protein